MKKLLNLAIILVFVTSSCKKEKINTSHGEVSFSINNEQLLKSLSVAEENISAVVISVKKTAGPSVYEFKTIPLYKFEENYLSEPISLNPGSYELTTFFVINNNDSVIYLTPKEGSVLEYLVSDPLPVLFDVAKDQTTKVTVEVISASSGGPEDFGYATFAFDILETVNFCVSVFEYINDSTNFELTGAQISVISEDIEIYTGFLLSQTNNLILPERDQYIITIQKPGYLAYSDTLIFDSIISYDCTINNPLIVILNKTDLHPNIVAHYPFNGNANDESGKNYHGTAVGALLTYDRNNIPNSAYHFNGESDYIYMGDYFDDFTTGSGKVYSFSLWIKRDTINTNRKLLLGKISDSNCEEDGRQYSIQLTTDNKIQFVWNHQLVFSHGWRVVRGSTELTDTSIWYHIVLTYDGNIYTGDGVDRIGLYINGVKENCYLADSHWELGDTEDGPAYFGLGNPIGSNGQSCGEYNFYGCIDDVFVFDKVLTEEEISSLYNN